MKRSELRIPGSLDHWVAGSVISRASDTRKRRHERLAGTGRGRVVVVAAVEVEVFAGLSIWGN